MKLVRGGHSWSGGEANRFFLNAANGRFYEMSSLAGLDHLADGRGLAVVDWDHDGKLDLWYRNRSAPRLRLMMNRRASDPSIAIRLVGKTCNRDGIGAVVELSPAATGQRLVRSVRAGDLFLSQSSKWLHFGIGGDGADPMRAEVLWPGGEREVFSGITSGGRFVLVQGAGTAQVWQAPAPRAASALDADDLEIPRDSGRARIILPSRIPMAPIRFRDQAARPAVLQPDGKPRLVIIWSGTCPHCKIQLGLIAAAEQALRAAGLELTALAVDGIPGPAADTSAAYDLIDAVEFPFAWGLIDAASEERIHGLQTALFDRTPARSVPLALLLDERADAVAIYRGRFEVAEVLADWESIRNADEKQLFHLAPPLRGTWFTNPLGQADVQRFIRGLYPE